MALNLVRKIDNLVKIKNVLVSVFDKDGLAEFVPGLVSAVTDITFYSTGGTFNFLKELLAEKAGKHLKAVSDYTGQPEMQGGLVKTLDFKIYLGLLSETYNEAHRKDLGRMGAIDFDMVVVNLYPFQEVTAKAGITPEEARTNIDIGGPCMIRASAKNHLRVASVTDRSDYAMILAELKKNNGALGLATRFALAKKAFRHTADYDKAIADFLCSKSDTEVHDTYELA